MCGIAGVLDPARSTTEDRLRRIAGAMTEALRHRGPDDGGVWVGVDHGVALGNRRLSVIDLSPTGHQPMQSASGRLTVVFNGEIYNHRQLRALLERAGQPFRGRSDTEVLVAAVERWGLEEALRLANGMFAVAVWDAGSRRLQLARDRVGEKPLYYAWAGRHLVFGSELEALRAHPDLHPAISRGALALFLRHSFVPAPHSIFEGVHKLPPGTVLTVDAGATAGGLPAPVPYWSLHDVAEAGAVAASAAPVADGTVVDEVHELLRDSVRLRMEADVPLGAFLSGGIDSSTVVALLQEAAGGRPVRTFTVAMPEAGFDESAEAAAVARHLGTDHTAVELSASDALAAVPRLPVVYDEPFADPSQLATLLVCEAARRHVTVALSGDGGDELFAGYNRYVVARRAWRWARLAPRPARAAAARALLALRPARWDALVGRLGTGPDGGPRVRLPGDKVQKLAQLLQAEDDDALYAALASQWEDPAAVAGAPEPVTLLADRAAWPALAGTTERMMYLDTVVGLPDGMLTKVDRASMSVGLEARVPLLDHRVVERAFALPLAAKIRDGAGKWPLRQVLRRYVPDRLVDRPKMGFDPPVGPWLRGPLRPWAEELLDAGRLAREGWLDPAAVRARWAEHLDGRRNRDYQLWAVLMFQAWLERR